MNKLITVRTVSDLRAQISVWRAQGDSIALVPTMGALHEGHLSLVRMAKQKADRVCATLFVNPKQFAPNEDFSTYPRSEESDSKQLQKMDTDLLFAPAPSEIYPEGHSTSISIGPLADILEGEHRPGFFSGVATVVSKLLLQSLPDIAIFGEKDYQQLQVIKKVVRDLDIPVSILGAPTVREDDGLALSSRNAYLSEAERRQAPKLYQALNDVALAVKQNADIERQLEVSVENLEKAGFTDIDYLTIRDAQSLLPVRSITGPCRILAAAKLGSTRLIDNIALD